MKYKDTFSPIDPDYYDLIDELVKSDKCGKIFFFSPTNELDEISGHLSGVVKKSDGEYLATDSATMARLDKVITIFGKPGPAFDEYDRYANACLTCEDIGQFGH